MVAWQPSLLDLGRPRVDRGLAALRRVDLGRGAWIAHAPRWLHGHAEVFEALRDGTRWRAMQRQMYERIVQVPRLVASLPEDGPGHPVIGEVVAALSARFGAALDRVSLAYYRDGRDSVALHGDQGLRDLPCDTLVATVSVGEPRRFLLKPVGGGPSRALSLGWGDLLVMGGSCQRTWLHGVPKAARAGPRISIMLRASAGDARASPPARKVRERGARW